MKLSEILHYVTCIKDYENYANYLHLDNGKNEYLVFSSNVANTKYIDYYLRLNKKLPEEITIESVYDIEIEKLPSIMEQNLFVINYVNMFEFTVGYYMDRSESLINDIRNNLNRLTQDCNNYHNLISLISVTNEILFYENLLKCDFNKCDEFATSNRPSIARIKYLLYYIHLECINISKNNISEYVINLPTLRSQDLLIVFMDGITEKIRFNKKHITDLTDSLQELFNKN